MKLLFCFTCFLSVLPIVRAAGVEDFETGAPTACSAEHGSVAVSPAHFKSGKQSLAWQWSGNGASLTLKDPAPAAKPSNKAGFALWVYQEFPCRGKMDVDMIYQGKVVASGWFWMDFTGWRILGAGYGQLGVPAGQPVDAVRFHAPDGSNNGRMFLDMCHMGIDHAAPRSLQTPWVDIPDGLKRPVEVASSADDPARNRPWLPTRGTTPTDAELADIKVLETAFLTRRPGPGKGLPKNKLEELRGVLESYQIRKTDKSITGRPIDGGTALKPEGFIPFGEYLKTLDAVKNAYYQAKEQAEADELKAMFCCLAAHLLDQGWAPGFRLPAFDNYPFGQYSCFYAMKHELTAAGLIRPVAQALFDGYCSHGPLNCLSEHPSSTMDGVGFWNRELYACSVMYPTAAEQVQYLKISKRFLDMALVEPTTIAPDGCTYHHGGFHYAYASYNMPRLLQVLEKVAPTRFRISAEAHERLRVFVRSLAFTSSAGEQAYNLGMRPGTPMNTGGVEAVARMLANIGTPDGKQRTDTEMASISLRLLAETSPAGNHPNFAKPPWKTWLDAGIKPARQPEGFLPLNGGTIAVHRRDGWLANISGMTPHYRCLEIYGWTQANNYSRYARNGSLVITSQGSPPNLAESGWAYDGWHWCHFPGTTAVRVANETRIFDGYAMYGNSNPNEGGTRLGLDGVWCLDHAGAGIAFRKTYFCFDNRITSITTAIKANGAKDDDPRVTTLFQNSIRPDGEIVTLDGEPLKPYPFERVVSFEKNRWLIDNKQTGYLIPSGNDPLHLSAKKQSWRYMIDRYLVDKSHNPISGDIDYRNVRGKVKDLGTLEKYYRPSEGDFALAWFDHGPQPASGSCVYTAVVRTTEEEMKRLAEKPPCEFILLDDKAHILRDIASDTFGYAIYQAGGNLPPATPLRSCSHPCTVILRRGSDGSLSMGAAYTCAGNAISADKQVELRMVLDGKWKTTEDSTIISARPDQGNTLVCVRPVDNTPINWSLKPL